MDKPIPRLKDSLSKSQVSIKERLVEVYLCGHTAYRPPHLGNMRPVVVFDLLIRILRFLGKEVRYVRNVTDIDDKIIEEAASRGVDLDTVTGGAIAAHKRCEEILGCAPPTLNPHATGYIERIIKLAEEFISKGRAYKAGGNVFFKVPEGQPPLYPSETRPSEEARCQHKRNQRDFAVWKAAKPEEPSWPSPFGFGRPGWHTECVAMILETTSHLTIHGGGCDLRFPHHANELLQLKECHHLPRMWLHTGMVVDERGQKMSKSLGNTSDFLQLAENIPGVILRIALLSTRYCHPLPWGPDKLKQAEKTWFKLLQRIKEARYKPDRVEPCEQVVKVLSEDFNTPEAITRLLSLSDHKLFYTMDLLGLFDAAQLPTKTSEEEVSEYVKQYKEARAKGDYKRSDEIRSALQKDGIHVDERGSWYCGLPEGYQSLL